MLSTKDIDKKIQELQKQKKMMEELKEKLVKTIGEEVRIGNEIQNLSDCRSA